MNDRGMLADFIRFLHSPLHNWQFILAKEDQEMRISKQAALLVVMGLCVLAAIGFNSNDANTDDATAEGEPRRRGFCIVPVNLISDAITGDCNWDKRNDIEWLIEPTILGGEFVASGRTKSNSTRVSWQAGQAMTSGSYYSPFQLYADCDTWSVGAVLPPLSGGRTWSALDPPDTVAHEWTTDGRSFTIRASVPPAWETLDNLELHVHSGTGRASGTPLSVAKIKRE